MSNINWTSMILATFTPIVIGYFIYRKSIGDRIATMNAEGNGGSLKLLATAVISVLLCFMLAYFMLVFTNDGIHQEAEFDTFGHGAWHGLFITVTVAIPIIVTSGFFGKKSWKSMLISIVFWLITLVLMGGTLDAMNHWQNIPMPEGF